MDSKRERIIGLMENRDYVRLREVISSLVDETGWSQTRDVIKSAIAGFQWFRQYKIVLAIFGLEVLEGIDVDPEMFLDSVTRNLPFEEIRKKMKEHASSLLTDQLRNNGSTLFFNLDKITTTEFAVHVPEIIELRKKQFSSLYNRLVEHGLNPFDEIIFTHYGFEILKTQWGKGSFDDLLKAFEEAKKEMEDVSHPFTKPMVSKNFRNLAITLVQAGTNEMQGHKMLLEMGYPSIESAKFFFEDKIYDYDYETRMECQFLAIQALEKDQGSESTEFLKSLVKSFYVEYADDYPICSFDFDAWRVAVRTLISRNEGMSIVSELEALFSINIKISTLDTMVTDQAAMFYAEILGERAFHSLWRNFHRSGRVISWLDWGIWGAIKSIGPSINKELFNRVLSEIKEYAGEATEAYFRILEDLGPENWSDKMGMALAEGHEDSKRLIEYISKHDKSRALREMCYVISYGLRDDWGLGEISNWIESVEMKFTQDSLIDLLSDDEDPGVVSGAIYCLGAIRSSKTLKALEKLLTDGKYYDSALEMLVQVGSAEQVFRILSDSRIIGLIEEYHIYLLARRILELGDDAVKRTLKLFNESSQESRLVLTSVISEIDKADTEALRRAGCTDVFLSILETVDKTRDSTILTKIPDHIHQVAVLEEDSLVEAIRKSDEPWITINLLKKSSPVFFSDVVLDAAKNTIPVLIEYMRGDGKRTGEVLECISQVELIITDKGLQTAVKETIDICRERRAKKTVFTEEEIFLYRGLHYLPSLRKRIPKTLRIPSFFIEEPAKKKEEIATAIETKKPGEEYQHSEEFERVLGFAKTQYNMGRYRSSEDAYRKAISLYEGDYEAWKGLGESLLKQNKYFEGIEAIQRAKELASTRN